MQKDNSTFTKKAALRSYALTLLEVDPVVMETHGGEGLLYAACYRHVPRGVVFEKDPDKAVTLAGQRPGWSVYEADSEAAIRAGAGRHLEINFLDLDPYGGPWNTLEAFFVSDRPFAKRLVVAVNDGQRQNVRRARTWAHSNETLRALVGKYGNNSIDQQYLAVCKEALEMIAAQAGYGLDRFAGYYCGDNDQMTHYLGVLVL